jgi:hypothetical protein
MNGQITDQKVIQQHDDILDFTDNVSFSQIEQEEEQAERAEEMLDWQQQFEYLLNHYGEVR